MLQCLLCYYGGGNIILSTVMKVSESDDDVFDHQTSSNQRHLNTKWWNVQPIRNDHNPFSTCWCQPVVHTWRTIQNKCWIHKQSAHDCGTPMSFVILNEFTINAGVHANTHTRAQGHAHSHFKWCKVFTTALSQCASIHSDLTAGPLYLCQWWVVSGTEPQVNSITINKTWS